jgi:hypothetical protein
MWGLGICEFEQKIDLIFPEPHLQCYFQEERSVTAHSFINWAISLNRLITVRVDGSWKRL